MSRRRRVLRRVLVTVVAVVAVAATAWVLRVALLPPDTPPEPGAWTTTVAYAGATPGAFGLEVGPDGRVVVTGAPPERAWWAGGGHDLRLHGDRVEVRAGEHVVGELRVRHRAGELRLLDPSSPNQVLRLRKL